MSNVAQSFYENMFRVWDSLGDPGDEVADIGRHFLEALAGRRDQDGLPEVFCGGIEALHEEYNTLQEELPDRKTAFNRLKRLLLEDESTGKPKDEIKQTTNGALLQALWRAFFPEALHLDSDLKKQIDLLRDSRRIDIRELVADPIDNVPKQILFTSNILYSPPVEQPDTDIGGDIADILKGARATASQPQKYWYDHPIPIGTAPENDEVVYGLTGLAQTLAYEKKRGTVSPDAQLKVCLSISVTHEGLERWALPWLRAQLASVNDGRFEGLKVYAITQSIVGEILGTLSSGLKTPEDEVMSASIGVDGEYGRHYSFLKALPALWAVAIDSNIKATFKIDLDQVFPQELLCAETGKSAFEHFATPLWGARGRDTEGRNVELGMIAGALVNEKDIAAGLFTPDIPWPEGPPKGDDLLFYKQIPMAVSTRAELMTRYGPNEELDGISTAIHRIHVTGGTNGIRIDALRRYRPFTPSFIGRAEDQGYLLSVLFDAQDGAVLRYAHASGLIMRHDKEAFAQSAVKVGKIGSYIGDLVRLFVFSTYANFLPWGKEETKKLVNPFTGCFITPIPRTVVLLRLALCLLSDKPMDERRKILDLANKRIPQWLTNCADKSALLEETWLMERRGWNRYYDLLDSLETALRDNSSEAKSTTRQLRDIVQGCHILG